MYLHDIIFLYPDLTTIELWLSLLYNLYGDVHGRFNMHLKSFNAGSINGKGIL